MREEVFHQWLESNTHLGQRAMSDAISRCKRIERLANHSLDDEFQKDCGRRILSLLVYSKEDWQLQKPAPAALCFTKGANLYNGMTSLRNAANLYFDFCRSEPSF